MRDVEASRADAILAEAQGAVYVATGLWPVLHLRSFEAVTGPKREGWLVKGMGLLIAAIGATLVAGARSRRSRGALAVLGATSAAALGATSLVYAAQRRISPVYFLDAAMEISFVGAWLLRRRRRGAS